PLPALSKPAGRVAESNSFSFTPRVIDIVGSSFLVDGGVGVEVDVGAGVPAAAPAAAVASVSSRSSIWPRRSTCPGLSGLSVTFSSQTQLSCRALTSLDQLAKLRE